MKCALSVFLILFGTLIANPTVSMIVPCDSSHIQYLPQLLESIANQSKKPSEVVISVSNCTQEDTHTIAQIESQSRPFSLKIIQSSEKKPAGENRNIAIENSSGNLIICQDADDLPHKQRVEIISRVFEQRKFAVLYHLFVKESFSRSPEAFMRSFNKNNYVNKTYRLTNFGRVSNIFTFEENNQKYIQRHIPRDKDISNTGITLGSCAFNKDVFNHVQFEPASGGEDMQFYRAVSEKFRKVLLINFPLIYYLNSRSATGYEPSH